MQKQIILFVLLAYTLYAIEFDKFAQKALKNSVDINSKKLDIQISREQKNISLKYKNPELTLQANSFDSLESGYNIEINQPIRLWGVTHTKELLFDSKIELKKLQLYSKKALFLKELSNLYIEYKKAYYYLELIRQEKEIVDKIYNLTKTKYSDGGASKLDLLKASTLINQAKADIQLALRNLLIAKSDLQIFANLKIDDIDISYKFKVVQTKINILDIQKLKELQNIAILDNQLYSKKIKWINLYFGYEQEPNQNIASLGLNIPIKIFDTNSAEQQIQSLKLKNLILETTIQKDRLGAKILSLKQIIKSYEDERAEYQKLIVSNNELLNLYNQSYKISKLNLINLLDIKSQLIQNKKHLIWLDTKQQNLVIELNYIQGVTDVQ